MRIGCRRETAGYSYNTAELRLPIAEGWRDGGQAPLVTSSDGMPVSIQASPTWCPLRLAIRSTVTNATVSSRKNRLIGLMTKVRKPLVDIISA